MGQSVCHPSADLDQCRLGVLCCFHAARDSVQAHSGIGDRVKIVAQLRNLLAEVDPEKLNPSDRVALLDLFERSSSVKSPTA